MGFDVGGVALTSPGTTLSVDKGAVNWMKVSAAGVLTRPQTPYMRGQIIRGVTVVYGNPIMVQADVNFGNCWNDATGLWTCPVAGDYMACAFSIAGGMPSSGYFYLCKNAVAVRYTHWNHASSWHNATISGIIRAAAGDTISWAVLNQSPANAGVHGNGNHAMYSIALMA